MSVEDILDMVSRLNIAIHTKRLDFLFPDILLYLRYHTKIYIPGWKQWALPIQTLWIDIFYNLHVWIKLLHPE